MASDINDLCDSEALYYDDDLGGTLVSQSQFEDGHTHFLNVCLCL
jgi:hypothetical protein